MLQKIHVLLVNFESRLCLFPFVVSSFCCISRRLSRCVRNCYTMTELLRFILKTSRVNIWEYQMYQLFTKLYLPDREIAILAWWVFIE